MGSPYTRFELLTLEQIEKEYGFISYTYPQDLEILFYKRTGIYRKHGTLYMANWRRREGYYNKILMHELVK